MDARFSRVSVCMLLLLTALVAVFGSPGSLRAAGYTDQDEEAGIGDPGEKSSF